MHISSSFIEDLNCKKVERNALIDEHKVDAVLILVYWERSQASFLVSDPQSINEERAKGMEDKVFYGLTFILLIGTFHNISEDFCIKK